MIANLNCASHTWILRSKICGAENLVKHCGNNSTVNALWDTLIGITEFNLALDSRQGPVLAINHSQSNWRGQRIM